MKNKRKTDKQKYLTANKNVRLNKWRRKTIDLPREVLSYLDSKLNKKLGSARPRRYAIKRLLEKFIIENYKNIDI